MVRYITHFTVDTPYVQEAAELRASAAKFDLEILAISFDDSGDWARNAGFKAQAILNVMMASAKGDRLVYVDADARFKSDPTAYFEGLDGDFAAHMRAGTELLSGTLFFKNTAPAQQLVQDWANQMVGSRAWDQKVLHQVVLSHKPHMYMSELDAPYCKIFDSMKGDAVIEHTQASRRHKRTINRRKP
ncbi:MAG: hypothetical protein ACI88C_000027 [Acidimicrobiales bacterium]|jgi:hypothetical protein